MAQRSGSEVERFLLRLGLPQRVVDIFNREQCYDLSSFLYLTPDDLVDLDTGDALAGVDPELWENATKAVLAGVDEVKVQTEHAWELSTLQDGSPFYFNPLTLETRWERPPSPTRQPRFDIDWTASVQEIPDNEEEVHTHNLNTYTYFNAVQDNPAAFEDKDWSPENESSSPAMQIHLSVPEVQDNENEMYNDRVVVGSNDDYLYDFGKVVSPKTSRSSSPLQKEWYDQENEGEGDEDFGGDEEDEEWLNQNEIDSILPQDDNDEEDEGSAALWYVCVDSESGATEGPYSMIDLQDWHEVDLVPKETLVTDLNDWWTLHELVTWHQSLQPNNDSLMEEEVNEDMFHEDEIENDHFLCTPSGEVVGPYSKNDVEMWYKSGMLEPGTLVSRGDGVWVALDEEKEMDEDITVEENRIENWPNQEQNDNEDDDEDEEDGNEQYRNDERRRSSVEQAARASAERQQLRSASQDRLFAPFYAGGMTPSARWQQQKEDQAKADAQHVLDSVRQEIEEEERKENADVGRFYVLNALDEVEGPYDSDTVTGWYEMGELVGTTLVCSEFGGEWVALENGGLNVIGEIGNDSNDDGDAEDTIEQDVHSYVMDEEIHEWHLLSEEGEVLGPYHRTDLERWYFEGAVDGSVMVHHPEMEDWISLQKAMGDGDDEEDATGIETDMNRTCYVLNTDTNEPDGPYSWSDVVHWYSTGDIDGDAWVSVDESDWVQVDVYMNGTDVNEQEEEEDDGVVDEQIFTLGEDNEINGPYNMKDITYWMENGDMASSALVSVPDSMQDQLGNDWIELQTLIDKKAMSTYESWKEDDNNFAW